MTKKYILDDEGREAAKEFVANWTANAFQTGPIASQNRPAIVEAVQGLYQAANLTPPLPHRIVIVPSPFVARFAAGAASWIWYCRNNPQEFKDQDKPKNKSTSPKSEAELTPIEQCIQATYEIAGKGGLLCAQKAWRMMQGGNMWSSVECLIAFGRDYIGLDLDYSKYKHWETLAKLSGPRFMHPEFCIISEMPDFIHLDAEGRGHCENGPYIGWSDGTGISMWHGTIVPDHWLTNRETLDPNEVLKAENVEQRAAGLQIVGLHKMKEHPSMNYKIVDGDPSTRLGALVEMTLDGLPQPCRFLEAECPRNGRIIEGVPRKSDIDNLPIDTAIAAQAWRIGEPAASYQLSPRRT